MCSEQLFCSCPPFLRHPGTQQQLHFTKHNYDDQYAILGKAKVGGSGRVSTTATCTGAALLRGARLHPAALVQGRGGVPLGQGGGQGQERRPLQVPPSPSSLEVQTKVHPKVRNHGEGPYKGLLLVESGYYRFHI